MFLKCSVAVLLLAFFLAGHNRSFAQSNNTETFERANILSGSSPMTWTSSQSAAGFLTTTTAPIDGSSSLTFNAPSSGTTTPIMYGRIAGPNSTFSIGSNTWEWTFVYQAPATVTPADNNGATVSGNDWRFWVNASGNDPTASNFKGYYVTQDGSSLIFYYFCNGCGGRASIGSLTGIVAGNKYIIRVVHDSGGGGEWNFYATTYTGSTSYPTTSLGSTYDQLGGNSSTYNYSFFQASLSSSANNGIFKWDDLSMYQDALTVTGLNNTSNGITTTVNPGDVQKAFFGFKLTALGQFTINSININFAAGSNNSYFTNAKLYISNTDDIYTGGSDDVSIANATMNGSFTSITGLSQVVTNGSKSYFLVADVQAFNNSSSPATVQFAFTSGTSNTEFTTTATTFNSFSVPGATLTMPSTSDFIWTGNTSSDPSVNSNWSNYSYPSASSNFTIPGGRPNYPVLTLSSASGTLTFTGTGGRVTINSGYTFSPGSITLANGATASIIGPGSTTSASNMILNSGSSLTLSSPLSLTGSATLTNAGTINVSSTSVTVAGASTNTGTINQTGSGGITFSGTLDNTGGDIEQTGTGTFTTTGAFTNGTGGIVNQTAGGTLSFGNTVNNTGSITQSSTGTIGVTGALTNNSGGSITLGSGTGTFNSTITNNSGGTLAFGSGTENIAGNFSNAGTFTDGAGTYNFNGAATFTNTGTITLSGGSTATIKATTFSNTSPGTFTASAGTVNFNLAGAQAINNTNTTSPVTFNNVIFGTSGIKTLNSSGTGNFAVASSGVLTLSGTPTLAMGTAWLTLNSSASGSGSIATIPAGASVTGTLNVQRFITGGSGKRGYRLLSSPVNSGGTNYSINYLANSCFLTGTTAGNGIDQAGNPTLYLFRENLAPSQASFTSGNFRGIAAFGASGTSNTSYTVNIDGGPYNIPVGNGFLFFFRGDRSVASIGTETVSSYVPTSTTLTATGTLNTGNITVKDWYNAGSSFLGYTTATANSSIRGYNLVGNPYPSTINWEKFNRQSTLSKSSIYGAGFPAASTTATPIYIFNSTSKQYAVYTPHTTISSAADTTTTEFTGATYSSDGVVSNMIASGQGFFIVATAANSQSLTFRESAKVSAQASSTNLGRVFSASTLTVNPESPAMRIKLIADSVNTDAVTLIFDSSYSTGYLNGEDALDAGGDGATVSLSSVSSDNIALTVNRLPLPKTTPLVSPLDVSAIASGNYQLKMDALENLPAIYQVWLMDNLMKDSLDMRANSTYSFLIDNTNAATYGSNRFQLVIRQSAALSLHLLNFTALKVTGALQSQLTWTVENESNYTSFNVQRSTDGGKTYQTIGGLQSDGLGTYSFIDQMPVSGTDSYRLQMSDINSNITYSQVISLQFSNLSNSTVGSVLSVYPNPTQSQISIAFNSTFSSSNGYNLMITNSLGVVVKQVNSVQPTTKYDVSAFAPGIYYVLMTDNSNNTVIAKSKFVKL